MYASPPEVSFANAETLLEPDDAGEGNWVGAPAVHRHRGTTYLAVRYRDVERRGYAVVVYEYDGETLDAVLEITTDLPGEAYTVPVTATSSSGSGRQPCEPRFLDRVETADSRLTGV